MTRAKWGGEYECEYALMRDDYNQIYTVVRSASDDYITHFDGIHRCDIPR